MTVLGSSLPPQVARQRGNDFSTCIARVIGNDSRGGTLVVVDCSKSALAVSLGQKVVLLAVMAIGVKGQSTL